MKAAVNGALQLQKMTARKSGAQMRCYPYRATDCLAVFLCADTKDNGELFCGGQGMSEDLLLAINHEATRRMTSLVAPQASEQHGPEMLRLSMGPLFEQARSALTCHCMKSLTTWGFLNDPLVEDLAGSCALQKAALMGIQ